MKTIDDINKDPYNKINELSVEELEKIITLACDKYYNTKSPIISDEIYDLLIDFLKFKSPKSKVLLNVGSKVKNKIKLDYWLGSMNKIKPFDSEFTKYINTYKSPYYISDKLDGVSALLIYQNNKIINLYTRGDGNYGTDITNLIKYLKLPSWELISETKEFKINNKLVFRGELILDKKIFDENWKNKMKNARNAVSGLVNSKSIKPKLANDTKLILYEVIEPLMIIDKQYKLIKKLNFNMVQYKIFDNINFEILSNYLKERREESEYFIDGIIVNNNELNTKEINKNPDYAFAYKDILEDQKSIAKVITIEWNISKDGYIKPTVILEPVNIGGVKISRVTGNNAKFIIDNKIGMDAIIELIRSGDVIPKIQTVLKPSKKINLPNGLWHWNETNVDIISNNLNSKEMLIKNIYFFFSTLNAKGIGSKIISKLVEYNYDSILKIIQAKKEDLINLNIFKEKTAENVVTSIEKSILNISLDKLMAASNLLGHGIGYKKIKLILNEYPNLLTDSLNWSEKEFVEKLKKINSWEEKTSNLFVSNFNKFKEFYDTIKDIIIIKNTDNKIVKNIWTNKNIVFSGFRDLELEKKLENFGAIINKSLTKKIDILIIKDNNKKTSKIIKALELGIKIITINEIY